MLADGWRLLADGCELLAPCNLLKAQDSRLKAQGSRLKAQGARRKAQGSRLKAQSSAIFDGQRDYSEQTLATPAFQRMSAFRGVVNMVLVSVKVQCVIMRFLVKSTTASYTITRITFAHNSQHSYSALHCFFDGQDRIPQNYEFGPDRTMTCESRVLFAMRKCVCGEDIKHMCWFSRFS